MGTQTHGLGKKRKQQPETLHVLRDHPGSQDVMLQATHVRVSIHFLGEPSKDGWRARWAWSQGERVPGKPSKADHRAGVLHALSCSMRGLVLRMVLENGQTQND